MNVGVGDFEARDQVAGTRGAEDFDDGLPDALGDLVHVRPQLRRQVSPLVDLLDWNNKCVAVGDRLEGQKRRNGLIAVNEPTGDVPANDFGENSAHGP